MYRCKYAFAALLVMMTASQVKTAHSSALTIEQQFNANAGLLVSIGYDSKTQEVWTYSAFASEIRCYSRSGVYRRSIPRPGEAANDVDIDFITKQKRLGSAIVPANSMMFVNGETGFTDIYGVKQSTGAVISILNTVFGRSHVVGGAYHPGRGTVFLVADRLDASPSTIAEVSPSSGRVLRRIGTGSVDFTIYYGDIDVNASTGNLWIVSSDETRIRELTPNGVVVKDLPLPNGVNSLSGIAIDDNTGRIFCRGNWRPGLALTSCALIGLRCHADP